MQLVARAPEQGSIRGVLHQGMLELVDDVRRRAALVDQLGIDQLFQRLPERRPRSARSIRSEPSRATRQ